MGIKISTDTEVKDLHSIKVCDSDGFVKEVSRVVVCGGSEIWNRAASQTVSTTGNSEQILPRGGDNGKRGVPADDLFTFDTEDGYCPENETNA